MAAAAAAARAPSPHRLLMPLILREARLPPPMRRRLLTLISVLAVAALFVGVAGPAAARKHRDTRTFCAKTGDFCVAIHHATSAKPRFEITSLAFGGIYMLCVTDSSLAQTCRDFTLHKQRFGEYHSNVSWRANFPVAPGRHGVAWFKDAQQVAPTLHFTPKS